MLNELRERGSLCSLLQRPGLTGREGGENTEHRHTITIFHLFCQGENGHEADKSKKKNKTRGLLHLLKKTIKPYLILHRSKLSFISIRPFFFAGERHLFSCP